MSSFLTNHGVVVALVCAACAVVYGLVTARSLLALSQLQMAYAREVQAAGTVQQDPGASRPGARGSSTSGKDDEDAGRAGPAEASGRLWVPGR